MGDWVLKANLVSVDKHLHRLGLKKRLKADYSKSKTSGINVEGIQEGLCTHNNAGKEHHSTACSCIKLKQNSFIGRIFPMQVLPKSLVG